MNQCAGIKSTGSGTRLLNSFFFVEEGYINLRQEYYKFSSNAHRSLASTVGSALGLGAGGLDHVYSAFFFVEEEYINVKQEY